MVFQAMNGSDCIGPDTRITYRSIVERSPERGVDGDEARSLGNGTGNARAGPG